MNNRNKGAIQLFFGFGTILLILIVVYVLLSLLMPETGKDVTTAVETLRIAATGS